MIAHRRRPARSRKPRPVLHPDPFQWTLDHRGEILEALYTVLSGNPRLYDRRKDEKTRFKLWQRMIGAAIEHAAELSGQGVDFQLQAVL